MEKRIREVKDEANRTSPPLFPRVHVNDTQKGGWSSPPPRSPIVLYQQMSVPSQSHDSDSPSTLSLTPATTSFSRGACAAGGREKNLSIPFRNTASPSKFADKLKSSTQSVSKCNVTVDSLEGKVTDGSSYPSLKVSLPSNTKPNSIEKNPYHFKNFSFENPCSLDYLKVPVLGCSETYLGCEKNPQTSTDLSLQLHTSSKKAIAGAVLLERPREYLENECEDNIAMESQDFHNSAQTFESSTRPSASGNQEIICCSENDLNGVALKAKLECLGDHLGEEHLSNGATQLSRRSVVRFNHESPKMLETAHQHEQVVRVHKNEDVSNSSGMDSGLCTSPNHVVKVIRDNRCSKIRTAMIDQQRIFTAQVFELHRLIMVQKTLARSPNMLREGKCDTEKSGTTKKFSHVLQMAPQVKPNAEKLKPTNEYLDECVLPKLPLPSINKELVPQLCSPTVMNGQPSNPWWFSAPGNHWLVPVVSPSEGLVYKPYAGSHPPTSGFVVPIFGNDSFKTALRFPVPHQFSHRYSPPNTMQRPNPFVHVQSWCSTSGNINQGIPFCLRRPEASKDSEVQGSTASSHPERRKGDVLPLFPTEPICPKAEADEHKQHPPLHVIKAIPHNPTSASESAARIFHFIQEERKQSDDMIS